jgi:outer membrane lipoprotein-sorting protein
MAGCVSEISYRGPLQVFNKIIIFIIVLMFFLPINVSAEEKDGTETFRLHSVRSDFRQEKHLQILARPIISDGTFIFQAPGSLRWEYLSPVRSVLLMHEGKVKKFIEQGDRLQEDKTMGFGTMQVVLADIANWLDGRFADNDMFIVTFPDDRTVLLVPKDKGLAALISSIELKVAGQKGLLDAVTIFEGPQSSTRLIFSKRILNQEIPASLFIAP